MTDLPAIRALPPAAPRPAANGDSRASAHRLAQRALAVLHEQGFDDRCSKQALAVVCARLDRDVSLETLLQHAIAHLCA